MGTLGRKAVWGAALALWVMIPAASASAAGGGSGKLDKLLQEAGHLGADGHHSLPRRRRKSDVKKRIERRKGRVVAEHKLIAAMTAVVSAADIADLANDADVLSVSVDADVMASASDKKSTPTSTTSSYSSADYTTVSTLKQALGLQDWFTGSNMTVAVIDSGIQSSSDFSGRIVGMYDFTPGRNGASVTPYRRVRPRHARRRPDRLERRVLEREVRGRGAGRQAARAARPRQKGRWQDQRGHRRARVRGRQQEQVRHPYRQPFARPSDLRVGRDRPARAGGGSGGARRARRRHGGRQLRHQSESPARSATPASPRPVTLRRRSPSARRTPSAPIAALTTASPITARAGRPGMTASPSPTSSPRARASFRTPLSAARW